MPELLPDGVLDEGGEGTPPRRARVQAGDRHEMLRLAGRPKAGSAPARSSRLTRYSLPVGGRDDQEGKGMHQDRAGSESCQAPGVPGGAAVVPCPRIAPASAVRSAIRMTGGCGSLNFGAQTWRKHGVGGKGATAASSDPWASRVPLPGNVLPVPELGVAQARQR